MTCTAKALFLDRDGILNEVVMRGDFAASPRNLGDFHIRMEAQPVVKAAKLKGYRTIVVTNQPDIERGLMPLETLQKMHQKLLQTFDLDQIDFCPASEDCDPFRKPNPGMLLRARDTHALDLSQSLFVGDGERDLLASQRAGIPFILLETDYNRPIHGRGEWNIRSLLEIEELLS